jgi:hypothetical protein
MREICSSGIVRAWGGRLPRLLGRIAVEPDQCRALRPVFWEFKGMFWVDRDHLVEWRIDQSLKTCHAVAKDPNALRASSEAEISPVRSNSAHISAR